VGALTLGHATVHWFGQAFLILLAEAVTVLGLSPLTAGMITGARALSGALWSIPMGMASDRFAAKRAIFMTLALAWFGGSFFLISINPGQATLIIFAAVLGIGPALWHPPAVGMLSTAFPSRRATAIAIHGVGASIGDVTGPLVVGGLLAFFVWQDIFRYSFIPAVLLAVLFLMVMRGVGTGTARGHTSLAGYFEALRNAARHRLLLMSVLAGGGRSAAQIAVVTFLPIYARHDLDLAPGVVGLLLALVLGLSIASQPVLAYISDRTNRKVAIIPGMIVLTVATPFLGLITSVWLLIALVSLIGLFMFSVAIPLGAIGLDLAPPELHSSVTAAQFLVGLGLGAIAPVAAGAIAQVIGIEGAFYFASGLFAVTLVMVLFLPATKGATPAPRFVGG
jgi:MFS family permease